MRMAVIVAPRPADPALVAAHRDGTAWLENALARLGFEVQSVDGEGNLRTGLERALCKVRSGDTVLVHVSGELAAAAILRIGAARAIPVRRLSETVAACSASSALLFAELTHDGAEDDAFLAAEHVAQVRDELEESAPGNPGLVAVHTRSDDPLAFTRLAIQAAEEARAAGRGAFVSEVVGALRERPEARVHAQSFTLVRGGADFALAPAAEGVCENVTGRSAADRVDELFESARMLVERLGDLPAAVAELERARAIDPHNADVAEALRRAYRKLGRWSDLLALTVPKDEDHEAVVSSLEAAAQRDPLDARSHAALFARHALAGDTDRAYLDALALEELGMLAPEHKLVLEQCRPDGLRMRAPLTDDAWAGLRAPGSDEVLESLFRAVGPAAIAAGLATRRGKMVPLDPERRQSPTSTASVVRSFHWAARALGAECPALYVLDRVPGDIAAVPAREPSTALGPGVLRGLSTIELAFVAGRHMTYYRPEHAVLLHFPTLQELTVLVLAALRISLPEMPVPLAVAPTVAALRSRLARLLGDEERQQMSEAIERLDARGGRVDLPAWIRSVELTAGRAGLLLSGDLRATMARVRSEARAVAGLHLEDRRRDLVAFCVSHAHAELRARVAVTTSSAPARRSGVMPRADQATAPPLGLSGSRSA